MTVVKENSYFGFWLALTKQFLQLASNIFLNYYLTMKKIYLVTDGADWILAHKREHGGGGVVADRIFKTLLNLDGYEPIVLATSKYCRVENNKFAIYIDSLPESPEFTSKVEKITKDAYAVLGLNTSRAVQGEILQCHSFLHRVKSANWFVRPIKYLLSRKKILRQRKRFSESNKYNRFFAVSNIIKRDYETNCGLKNIVVCYPGCDKIYDEFPENTSEILTFGIVANSSWNKNGHYFVLALGIAKMLGLKCKLKIIAPKFESDLIMKTMFKIFDLGEVAEVLDKQVDMSYFYKNIDCLVMPSLNEAFGLVALEALSYGKTCLVSKTTGFSEILTSDTGFSFDVRSLSDFVAKLKQIGQIYYGNRAEFNRICQNGFELSKKYSWKNFVLNLLKE